MVVTIFTINVSKYPKIGGLSCSQNYPLLGVNITIEFLLCTKRDKSRVICGGMSELACDSARPVEGSRVATSRATEKQ